MDVLGHEDVSEDIELMPGTKFFEFVEEDGPGGVVVEKWETTITAECDEVPCTVGLMTLQL
jgi:hypothetical protein